MGLRNLTRRHFFEQASFGIGGLALASLMDDVVLAEGQKAAGYQPRFRAEGEARHLSLHGRRPVADRSVRSEAGPDQARWPGHSRGAHQGRALRVHQGHAEAARLAVPVPEARPVGRRDLRAAAQPGEDRRQGHVHPLDADDAVQPCAGADLHEHRAPGDRTSEPRLLAQLWPRQRELGSAGVRRAAVRREQPGWRQVLLGERLPSDDAPGSGVPLERGAGVVRVQSGGRRRRRSRPVDRRDQRPEPPPRGEGRRPGDPDAHLGLRARLSHADERAGADGRLAGAGVDSRAVWHGARKGVVRQQLPARPSPRGARRPVRPALSPRLGHARRLVRRGHRGKAAAPVPADRPSCLRPAHRPRAARPARRTRLSSGAASSGARR